MIWQWMQPLSNNILLYVSIIDIVFEYFLIDNIVQKTFHE